MGLKIHEKNMENKELEWYKIEMQYTDNDNNTRTSTLYCESDNNRRRRAFLDSDGKAPISGGSFSYCDALGCAIRLENYGCATFNVAVTKCDAEELPTIVSAIFVLYRIIETQVELFGKAPYVKDF